MKRAIAVLMLCVLLFASCNSEETQPQNTSSESYEQQSTAASDQSALPKTNEELFGFIADCWNSREYAAIYEYMSDDIRYLMEESRFSAMLDEISELGGGFIGSNEPEVTKTDDGDVYSAVFEFDNVLVDLTATMKNTEIIGFAHSIVFKDVFERDLGDGVTERYFVLKNGDIKLNAVYTYVKDGLPHPSVLLIGGSGPSDYNETVGLLTPFKDIARELAKNRVNSLRIDKRTLKHAYTYNGTEGLDEEYFYDCDAALEYLRNQDTSGIYLLGHSLGGQIAAEIAANRSDIEGVILFNSTARHLADISKDQLSLVYPSDSSQYAAFAESAKKYTNENADASYYFGANGYYWASYNELDTLSSLHSLEIPILIVNSRKDRQTFDADISLWEENFASKNTVSLAIYEEYSHLGYIADLTDQRTLYSELVFPAELTERFCDFIISNSEA